MKAFKNKSSLSNLRKRLHEIIFEADTTAGKLFDIVLIVAILISVTVVMLDSVDSIKATYGSVLNILEWTVTVFFTIEFILRVYCVGRPLRYIFSFYGLIDLFSILPTYVGLMLPRANVVSVVRILRVCRIFRVLKFSMYLGEADLLLRSLVASRRKITVFLSGVISIAIILGAFMYILMRASPTTQSALWELDV